MCGGEWPYPSCVNQFHECGCSLALVSLYKCHLDIMAGQHYMFEKWWFQFEFSSDILKSVSQALIIKQFMQPYACHIWPFSASCHGDMGIVWCVCGNSLIVLDNSICDSSALWILLQIQSEQWPKKQFVQPYTQWGKCPVCLCSSKCQDNCSCLLSMRTSCRP